MRISVILSTYNRPDFLERVLWGYAVQTRRDFELVIADDGSSAQTTDLIEQMRRDTALRLTHVWHADQGFRKTLILNHAILAAEGDYLLFSDGDCIPRADLLAVHARYARPGRYLAGGYLKLPAHVSERVHVADVVAGRVADLSWLRAQGWKPGRRALRLTGSTSIGALFDFLTPTRAHFHGNNASVAKEALFLVNGFEQGMGYGGLDRALGYRLENAGIKGVQLRHRAVCLHLHHDRPYRQADVLKKNREILHAIRRNREIRAAVGLAELTPDPALRINGALQNAASRFSER